MIWMMRKMTTMMMMMILMKIEREGEGEKKVVYRGLFLMGNRINMYLLLNISGQ